MSGNTIFLLFIIGVPLAMMFMHRGGHSHGSGQGQRGGGMGGCGGGHNHSGHGADTKPGEPDKQAKSPLLGPPGTGSTTPVPARVPVEEHRH